MRKQPLDIRYDNDCEGYPVCSSPVIPAQATDLAQHGGSSFNHSLCVLRLAGKEVRRRKSFENCRAGALACQDGMVRQAGMPVLHLRHVFCR